uniref:Uncharacterized protein n=1 Tax=Aegilops tauschii TaxID=37682 RepID=M8ARM2_AEGTA
MGSLLSSLLGKPEPPPPMVLVPPLFDYPPIAARTRMSVPAYELMFGKLPLRNLFEDYFDNAGTISSRIMLKPLEDPHVDLVANVSAAGDKASGTEVKGDALFRWQKYLYDPHTFVDVQVSTSEPMLKLRSCAYFPEYRLGAFGTIPLLMGNRLSSEDYAVLGVRYGSENLSIGASFVPLPESAEVPYGAWLVGRKGSLCAGAQYKPLSGNKHPMPYTDPKNWNYAISYGVASTSPLSPSFNFSLELARNTQATKTLISLTLTVFTFTEPHGQWNFVFLDVQLIASFYQHLVVQRRGKLGPSKSSVALAFKSWWRPSFTFSVTAENDHSKGTTSYGFGIRVEDLRKPSYERADPNYVMMSTNKEHLAPAALREFGQRPMFQADVDSGNFDHLPTELRPMSKII